MPVTVSLAVISVLVTILSVTDSANPPSWLAPFVHGFTGLPAAVHLILNLTLLFLLGRRFEPAIGSLQTLLLTAIAYAAYLGVLLLTVETWSLDAVGLSGIVWAWALPAWYLATEDEARHELRPLLWLMLVWIPVIFAVVVVSFAGDNWLAAGVAANLFHAVGVLVGLVYSVATGLMQPQ